MKFLKSTVLTFFTNIFIFSISLITTVVTSRVLGTNGKGILSVSNNLISLSLIFLGLGIASSNVYFIGRNKKNMEAIIGINIIIAIFSIGILFFIFFLNLKFNFEHLFKNLTNKIIIITFFSVPLMILKASLINILLGLQEIEKYNKINIIDNMVTLLMLFVFIFITKSVFWVIIGNIIAVTVILLILSYILFYKKRYKISFDYLLFKEMLNYGIKAQIGNAVQFLNYRLDVLIIQNKLAISQVGIYSNAVALCETMWKVPASVSTIVLPMTSNSENKEELPKFINKVTRVTFFIIILCTVFLFFIGPPLILFLLGKNFSGSCNALLLLLPGISVFSVCNILSSYFAGVGMIEKNIIASSVSCVVTVVLDLILIPKIGINGASIATSISYIIATGITIAFYINLTKSKILDILIIKKEDLIEVKTRIMEIVNRRRQV